MRRSKTLSQITMLTKYGICLIVVLLVIFFSSLVTARSLFNEQSIKSQTDTRTAFDPYVAIRVHNVGKIGLTITNQGQIGTGFMGSMIDPMDPPKVAPSCTYPYPGNQS